MEIIFLHWGENYFPWKIIFHHLLYQTTENWKIFSRKIVFPLTKHYLNLTLFFSGARIFLVPINFPLEPMSSTRLTLLSMTHVSIFHNHFFFDVSFWKPIDLTYPIVNLIPLFLGVLCCHLNCKDLNVHVVPIFLTLPTQFVMLFFLHSKICYIDFFTSKTSLTLPTKIVV